MPRKPPLSSGGRPSRIISGGQTGVDRGALDAAQALGIAHGGWCPRGRLAEDGRIPDRYLLVETESPDYAVRTARNVEDSQATLILHRGPFGGGTKLTRRLARRYGRPCLLVDLEQPPEPSVVLGWLAERQVEVLNVAGPRESQARGIAAQTTAYLTVLWAKG
jgi:hypothetical protein